MRHLDASSGMHACLADLDEAAKVSRALEAGIELLAGVGAEDDVDAFAACQEEDGVFEAGGGGGEDVGRGEVVFLHQQVALGGAADCGEHGDTEVLGEHYGCLADAA